MGMIALATPETLLPDLWPVAMLLKISTGSFNDVHSFSVLTFNR
jgi:hypothetical protein